MLVSPPLKTGRVMVKDEDVCLHCGLCAERCPTGAWDMQKFLLHDQGGRGLHTIGMNDMNGGRRHESDRGGQRLRRQVRQRQRLGFGQRQRAVRQGHPAHGRAGQPAQHLSQQHPGPADLVRGARQRRATWGGAAAST
jgi:ferredoxin